MASKQFQLAGVGLVTVYKHRASRSIRLSVNSDGKIRVTQPVWLPYQAGLSFAKQKRSWLANSRPEGLKEGQQIGKFHRLHFLTEPETRSERGLKPRGRLVSTEARLYIPNGCPPAEVQLAAAKLAKRALLVQAEKLLPGRLQDLSHAYGWPYQDLTIRHLKTRWGSCNARQQITLNYYMMQLPWELIDYVLTHELAHTKEMNHSEQFWQLVERQLPNYKQLRKALRQHQPSVLSQKSSQ